MTPDTGAAAARPLRRHVGVDRAEFDEERLTILSPAGQMSGWEVRRHRASPIRFDGRTWRMQRLSMDATGLLRYELLRWEPADHELPGPEIDYTEAYVACRDRTPMVNQRRSRATLLLGFVQPLLGYLPARLKDRLETQYGIDPVASTFASIFIEALVGLGALALMTIYTFSGKGSPVTFLAISGAVFVDAAVRYSRLLNEERPAPGFYEWLREFQWRR
jgi:hypothetical protein